MPHRFSYFSNKSFSHYGHFTDLYQCLSPGVGSEWVGRGCTMFNVCFLCNDKQKQSWLLIGQVEPLHPGSLKAVVGHDLRGGYYGTVKNSDYGKMKFQFSLVKMIRFAYINWVIN